MHKLKKNGHIIVDKIVTAKHTIVGEDLARAILKATTDELALPKKKYVDYLVLCTKDQNISVLEMSKLILDRAHNPSWVVALKALLIVHEMMNYGNERFFQYMATDSQSLNLHTFSDHKDTTCEILLQTTLIMSKYVRSYASYINAKAVSFRLVGYDFCKVKRGGKEAFFKTLDTRKLFRNLTQLQRQLDSLLSFKPELGDLSNSLVTQAFSITFKDLVRLVACLNDGTANLLENFTSLNRKDCQESLSLYTNFPNYLKKVAKFYKIAENLSFETSQMPSLDQVPTTFQQQMEEHIKGMEVNKTSSSLTPLPKPASRQNMHRRQSIPASAFESAFSLQNNQPQEANGNAVTSTADTRSTTKTTSSSPTKPAFKRLSLSSPFGNDFADSLSGVGHKELEEMRMEEERILQMFRANKAKTEAESTSDYMNSNKHNMSTNNNTNNNNNNETGFDDFFASMDLSSTTTTTTSSSDFGSIAIPSKPSFSSPSNDFSTSLPPGFSRGESILEPTRLSSSISVAHSPPSPSSSTPTFLDFSKVSLPPSSCMPPNYMANPYNPMNPSNPPQILSAPIFPSAIAYGSPPQLYGLTQEQLQQEQQKQFMQSQYKNPFFY